MNEKSPEKVSLLIKLKPEVHKQFKMMCVEKNVYMNEVVQEQIVKWIEQELQKSGK